MEAIMALETEPGINTLYCIAKTAANHMARTVAGSLGIDYIRAVISNIYGPGEMSPRLVNTSLRKMLDGEHCSFTAGDQMYDFIYITDAAKAIAAIGEMGRSNKTYYVGSQNPRPLKEFLITMRDCVDPGIKIGLGEVPFKGVSLTYREFDIDSVKNDTGFVPTVSFTEGIQNTIAWLRRNGATMGVSGFRFQELGLKGAYLISSFYAGDNRGGFTKCFEKDIYAKAGIKFHLSETFVSRSMRNVIRGLHFQTHNPQAKLVSVAAGSVWDVIVDLRADSPTYKKWFSVELGADNHMAVYVPKGFAHGFLSLADNTIMLYQCDGAYDKDTDTGILFDDPEIGIQWPIDLKKSIRSVRDMQLMSFSEYDKNFRV